MILFFYGFEDLYPTGDDVVSGSPLRREKTAVSVQFRVLQAQREEIERRREALVEADMAQEERWHWLQQYHAWLQAQAQLKMKTRSSTSMGEDGNNSGGKGGPQEVRRRTTVRVFMRESV
jgi:hypothetical protein